MEATDKVINLLNQDEIKAKIAQITKQEGRLFDTEKERQIGGKAVGAYVGVLTSLLTEFMNKHPEHQKEIGSIIGQAAAICVKQIL
jgi:hypothetical protein